MKKIVTALFVMCLCLTGCSKSDTSDIHTDANIVLKGNSIESDLSTVKIDGSVATITSAGTYTIEGNLDDGQIRVEASDDDKVTLILNGVDIHNESSAAIYVVNAKKTEIVLEVDSENILSDTSDYEFESGTDEPNATLFSQDDLIISGEGKLSVQANYEDGIVSKDDLEILGGEIVVDAADDGIRGKDLLYIENATVSVNSISDALKSTNDTDEEKGIVEIASGTFNLVTTGSWDNSSKAIKSTNSIIINGGEFEINSVDDAIHATNVEINSGIINIKTKDDGVHADDKLVINDGTIKISESYEGLEAADLTINGGVISIVASDDGINAAGGSDSNTTQGQGGRPNDMFSASSGTLTITGGDIRIDAEGDGIDINGDGEISGGVIIVDGTTSGGDAAIDYDGTLNVSGGVIIAVGTSDMAQAPSTSSSQRSIMVNLTSAQSAGTSVRLVSSSGEEIISQTMSKQFASVVISSPDIQDNTTYDLYFNDTKYESITTSGIVTTSGSGGMKSPGGMQNNQDGGRGPNR